MDAGAVRERIGRRAYELYELRGRVDGFDLQDWLQAKQEVLSETRQSEKFTVTETKESGEPEALAQAEKQGRAKARKR